MAELADSTQIQSVSSLQSSLPEVDYALNDTCLQPSPTALPQSLLEAAEVRTCALPPPKEGSLLLQEYLVDFNRATPLFQPDVILMHFRDCYSGAAAGDPLAWVSLYVVLGIAHRLRGMSLVGTNLDKTQADFYLQISLKPLVNLLLHEPSLMLIQALLGLAILLQTSTHSQLVGLFVSTAMRMCQDLRFNEHRSNSQSDIQVAEQQERVFWIAFFMDMDVVFITNGLPCHRLHDIDVLIPRSSGENPPGIISAVDGRWNVHIFSLRAQLALLQAEAYERMLSVSARKSTAQELAATFHAMLPKFEEYRNHHLFQSEPSNIQKAIYQADMVHVMILEASYFQMLYRLQASSIIGWCSDIDVFAPETVAEVAPSVSECCYNNASRILELFETVPHGDTAISW